MTLNEIIKVLRTMTQINIENKHIHQQQIEKMIKIMILEQIKKGLQNMAKFIIKGKLTIMRSQ